MTDDPPPLTAELLDEYIRRVDLLIRGFANGEDQDQDHDKDRDKDVFGAPDFHGVALRSSRDFWDGRGTEVWEAADLDIENARAALIARLAERWGAPLTLDASPFLFPEAESVAAVLSHLATWGDVAQAWLLPATEQFLALAVCQADTEFPLELTAIVGRAQDIIDVLAG